jgi:hypothetical protein
MSGRHRNDVPAGAGCALLAFMLMIPASAFAGDAVLYRIFLSEGSTVVSYGEFTRVSGKVVFSMPISGGDSEAPQLQLVSIPENAIDWEQTNRYAEAARAKQYVETRGESDFSALSNEVARVLNEVALTEDPRRRLVLADGARRMLADWPAQNFGYRAADVAQLSALLDEVVSELRVAAGLSRFDLNFVASVAPPPPMPLMRPPTLRDSIEQALTVARLADDSAERVSLLRGIIVALTEPSASETWAAALRARAVADLGTETKADQAYAKLAARTIKTVELKARRGDVKSIESLVKKVLKTDDRLGRRRPQETAALLATLDARLDAARRLRLARDRWAVQMESIRDYERRVRGATDQFARSRPSLEQIRQLAGPSPKFLPQLHKRIATALRELALVKAPPHLDSVHTLLTSACQMAVRATETRGRAINANDMKLAWEASSAAAGALLLFDRAREELQRLVAPPGL